MDLEVRFRSLRGVPPLGRHELLRDATLGVVWQRADGGRESLAGVRDRATGDFRVALEPRHAGGLGLELDFQVPISHQGASFLALRVVQEFGIAAPPSAVSPVASPASASPVPRGAPPPLLTLHPRWWVFRTSSGRSQLRTVPAGTHPLLEQDPNVSHRLTLNPLMLDITEWFMAVHGESRYLRRWIRLADPKELTLRVLAHLGGIPYLWYAAIPLALANSNEITPHVFFEPEGLGAVKYGSTSLAALSSTVHAPATGGSMSGAGAIAGFVLPPLRDDRVDQAVRDWGASDDELRRSVNGLRNVHNVDKPKSQPLTPEYWTIPMGMGGALLDTKARQVLFLPQKHEGFNYERAQTSSLADILQTALLTLATQSGLVGGDGSRPLNMERMILSAYSDSGTSLWDAAVANASRLRGIIAIEPQHMHAITQKGGTTTGDRAIPTVVAAGAKVILIGRHKDAPYRPNVAPGVLARISFLPDDSSTPDADGLPKLDYGTVWRYPPDVAKNAWLIYRTYRLMHPDEDPFMDDATRDLIREFKGQVDAARRKSSLAGAAALAPLTYQQFIDALFRDVLKEDSHGNYYWHYYALGGGRKLMLPSKDPTRSYYGVPVRYKSFFHEAVELIG